LAQDTVAREPNNIPARVELARVYQLNKQYDEAIKQYDEILRVQPEHRQALLGRGRALYAKGDLDAAAVPLRQIDDAVASGEFAGADTQLQEARYFLAAIELAQDKPKEALADASAALQINPTDSDALLVAGKAYLATGDAAKALEVLHRAVAFVPTGWADPYQVMASAYQAVGEEPGARYAQAMTAFAQGDPQGAQAALEPLVKGPAKLQAMLGLGLVAEAQSQPRSAAKWYGKVLKLEPDNISAGAGLARAKQAISGAVLSGHGSADGSN
jgi:tetratricopeptide (TPR) repeat protein